MTTGSGPGMSDSDEKKTPWVGAALNTMPGAGYLYSGKWSLAIGAWVVLPLLYWAVGPAGPWLAWFLMLVDGYRQAEVANKDGRAGMHGGYSLVAGIASLVFLGSALQRSGAESREVASDIAAPTVAVQSQDAVTPSTPEQPQEMPMVCPEDFLEAGTRGCFTLDSGSKISGAAFSLRGRLISRRPCQSMVISVAALDDEGAVLCTGTGHLSDVQQDVEEPWTCLFSGCASKPTTLSMKFSTCRQ